MNQADPQQAFEPKVIVEFEKGCGQPGGRTANRWVKEIYGMSRLCKTVSICNSMFMQCPRRTCGLIAVRFDRLFPLSGQFSAKK